MYESEMVNAAGKLEAAERTIEDMQPTLSAISRISNENMALKSQVEILQRQKLDLEDKIQKMESKIRKVQRLEAKIMKLLSANMNDEQ